MVIKRSEMEIGNQDEEVIIDVCNEQTVILIVDDDRLVLAALEILLQMEGCHILTARSGVEALQIIERESVGVVICDQRMPEIQGIEVLQRVLELQPDAVRMLITGDSDEKIAIQAINQVHVHHFISKPWDNTLLKEIVANRVEQYRLLRQNRHLQHMLVEKHRALALSHVNLRRELQLGAIIHETLLMGDVPENIDGMTINATTIASREIDGDFFEFYQPSVGVVDVVIGDVMGKGFPAAVVATAVKTQMVPYANSISRGKIYDNDHLWRDDLYEPEEIINMLQQELAQKLMRLEYFVSLFYARFNLENKILRYVDCGFAKPFHYSAENGDIALLKGDNFPLGIVANDPIQSFETSFEEDDFFVFYSDGVTESMSPTSELFGVDRLMQLVRMHNKLAPSDLLDKIKESLVQFSEKPNFNDDVTIIVIKIEGKLAPKATILTQTEFRSDFSQLRAVRDYIKRFCRKASGNKDVLNDQLQLAINEVFCNIVKHGFVGNKMGKILLNATYNAEGVVLELSDQGPSFNPESIQEPSLSGERDDGFGWHIIRSIADKVIYVKKASKNGWNHLKIYKYFIDDGDKMDLTYRNEEEVLVIKLNSVSLDAKNAPEFKQKIIDVIMIHHSQRIVIDLSALNFIDSSGLGSFLAVLRLINSQGGELKLVSMSRAVRTMFELVSMHKIFDIYPSLNDAKLVFKSLKGCDSK